MASPDLSHFHGPILPESATAHLKLEKVRTLRDCCPPDGVGRVDLCRWHGGGVGGQDLRVVVKKMPKSYAYRRRGDHQSDDKIRYFDEGLDAWGEDPMTECGVYTILRQHPDVVSYLLQSHMAFERGNEVWLVLEHATGGDVCDWLMSSHAASSHQLKIWLWMALHAYRALDKLNIANRDLSVENLLLSGDSEGGPLFVKVMDHGQAVPSRAEDGTPIRYFSAAGKPHCRAPECAGIPAQQFVKVRVPDGAQPGEVAFVDKNGKLFEVLLPDNAVPGQLCMVQPCGYRPDRSDIFALGVTFQIMATRSLPPWTKAYLKDPGYKFVHDKGLPALFTSSKDWIARCRDMEPELISLLTLMQKPNPAQRPSVDECLSHPYFATLCQMPVAISSPTSWVQVASRWNIRVNIDGDEVKVQSDASEDTGYPCLLNSTVGGREKDSKGAARRAGEQASETPCSESTRLPLALPGVESYSRRPRSAEQTAAPGETDPAAGTAYAYSSDHQELGLNGDFYSCEETFRCVAARDQRNCTRKNSRGLALVAEQVDAAEQEWGTCSTLDEHTDSYFKLADTTLFIAGGKAADIGTQLVSFLRSSDATAVESINYGQVSMRARVGAKEGGECGIKVRVYRQAGGRHAVEFQRRSGSAFALAETFAKASEYFASQGTAVSNPVQALGLESVDPPAQCSHGESRCFIS